MLSLRAVPGWVPLAEAWTPRAHSSVLAPSLAPGPGPCNPVPGMVNWCIFNFFFSFFHSCHVNPSLSDLSLSGHNFLASLWDHWDAQIPDTHKHHDKVENHREALPTSFGAYNLRELEGKKLAKHKQKRVTHTK